MKRWMGKAGAMALALAAGSVSAQDITPPGPLPVTEKTTGSLYLQCDGNPNNMSAGESVARFVGAVTLLGLFAPAVEQPNPAARSFGAPGVTACSQLIDGARREGSPVRRLPLILARAIHRIEAGDYRQAAADVALARGEASAAKLAGDPYFDRSLGLSFDMIEAEALFAAGDGDAARAVSLRRAERFRYGYYPLIGIDAYGATVERPGALDLTASDQLARLVPPMAMRSVSIFEEQGRFGDAAARLDQVEAFNKANFPTLDPVSILPARAAIDLALAGDWTGADRQAAAARATLATRTASGKPETSRGETVEALDFYGLLRLAHDDKLGEARRGYAARSEWTAPAFGQQTAALRLLRADAKPEELGGALTQTPASLWAMRRDAQRAARMERYKDNKFLWTRILPYASAPSYERLSKTVWDGGKARYFAKTPMKDGDGFLVSVDGDPLTQADALVLHAAVVAKARGHRGFYLFMLPSSPGAGMVRFADPPADAAPPPLFIDAEAAIAELRDVIPTPADVERRRADRAKAQR